MKSSSKFVATVLAAALAAITISIPAFAHDPNNHRGPGILPALAGPAALAAAVGTSTNTWTTLLTKKLFFHKYNFYGWKKAFYLKKAGFDLNIYKKGRYVKVKATKAKHHSSKSRSAQGKAVVGCVMGSALGAISASIRKASALGNPPRWRSQAEHERIVASGYEKQFELTSDEAATALALCGLGSFALHWDKKAPVVTTKY